MEAGRGKAEARRRATLERVRFSSTGRRRQGRRCARGQSCSRERTARGAKEEADQVGRGRFGGGEEEGGGDWKDEEFL